jgi:pre-mRNA-splicing factor ATP-dependent RNA helicase DHX32
MADVIRAELLEIIKRIELPYAEPAFGSRENNLNIKKALLSGYFMQVTRAGLPAWAAVSHLG